MAFYDIFDSLCKERGISPTRAALDNGIKQQSVSSWKKRGSTPKAETIQKLANYFGVSTDYLIGKPNPFIVHDNDSLRRAIKEMTYVDTDKIAQEIEKELSNDSAYKTLEKIGEALGKLNDCGQQEAVKRVEELTEIPRYQAKREQE